MAKHRRETECKFELYGADMFVVYNGQRIAKRGEPGTPQAGTWVVLAPGLRRHRLYAGPGR
jgi:hypothetical protein